MYHLAWALLSILIYGKPSKKLTVIGITGTDGKTTTSTMLYEILKTAGKKVAMINGLQFVLPSKSWKNHSDNSTPGKFIIRKFLREALKENCEYVILEVTSWGIEQFRVFGIDFDVAVITNLTYEHLDLHGSMNRYKKMKGRLFAHNPKVSVVNADDDFVDYFASFKSEKKFVYSRVNSDLANVQAENINGTDFELQYNGQTFPVSLKIKGDFNISNALAASSAAIGLGVTLSDITKALSAIKNIPGRMEFINEGQDFFVVVDFAHTPNGFESLFKAARKIVGPDNNVIAVYGATGGRDQGRRPMVGEIAGNLVDFSVLTSEDPRTEDPKAIADQIITGLAKQGKQVDKDYTFIKDRAEAILYACKKAKNGDIVLLCSMGDYDVMYVGEGKVKWSDRQAAKDAIKQVI